MVHGSLRHEDRVAGAVEHRVFAEARVALAQRVVRVEGTGEKISDDFPELDRPPLAIGADEGGLELGDDRSALLPLLRVVIQREDRDPDQLEGLVLSLGAAVSSQPEWRDLLARLENRVIDLSKLAPSARKPRETLLNNSQPTDLTAVSLPMRGDTGL